MKLGRAGVTNKDMTPCPHFCGPTRPSNMFEGAILFLPLSGSPVVTPTFGKLRNRQTKHKHKTLFFIMLHDKIAESYQAYRTAKTYPSPFGARNVDCLKWPPNYPLHEKLAEIVKRGVRECLLRGFGWRSGFNG